MNAQRCCRFTEAINMLFLPDCGYSLKFSAVPVCLALVPLSVDPLAAILTFLYGEAGSSSSSLHLVVMKSHSHD